MQYTNVYGLPAALYRAIVENPYDRGDADISVTGLIAPPQIEHLRRKHDDEIEVDVSDLIWTLLGRGVHAVLEGHGGGLEEERLYAEYGGLKISGATDLLHLVDGVMTVDDYKVTSVWSAIYGLKPEWEAQTNLYRWLWRENGFGEIEQLRINCILRDWVKSRALKSDYPNIPFHGFDVPVWDDERLYSYLDERVAAHTAETPPPCTNEERWYSGDQWAVKKPANKTARKLFETREEAEVGRKPDEIVEHREGGYRRCEAYCDVAEFCPQWNVSVSQTGGVR